MFACKSEIKGYFICTKKLLPVTDFLLRDDCFKRIFGGLNPDMCIYMTSDFQFIVRDCNKAVISNFKFLKIKLGNGSNSSKYLTFPEDSISVI